MREYLGLLNSYYVPDIRSGLALRSISREELAAQEAEISPE